MIQQSSYKLISITRTTFDTVRGTLHIFLCYVKNLKNMIHQFDNKKGWLLLSASCTTKFGLVFVLTLESVFSQRFHFKLKRKSIGSSKNGTRDFQNSTPFERSECFYVKNRGNFTRFQYFNFETDFLKIENLFQKTGVLFLN